MFNNMSIGTHLKWYALFLLFLTMQNILICQTFRQKITLDEAAAIGLKNNPEVKIAKENISSAKGKFWSGISLPQPEIGVSYEYAPVNKSLSNYGEKTLSVSQSLEFPANYFLKGNKLNKEEEIEYQKWISTKRSVLAQIKTGYYKVLAKQKLLELAGQNLKIAEDFYNKVRIRQNVGEGTNLERLTAQVQYSEAANNYESVKNELVSSLSEFNYSLGIRNERGDQKFIPADSLGYSEIKEDSLNINPQSAENNPRIKIAELKCGISSLEKKLAWSSLLPNINLAYFKQTRDGDSGLYGASFGLSIPLWFLTDQRGKIQEATANQAAADSELQLNKNEIMLKLENIKIEFENSRRQVMLYMNDILPQAQEIDKTAVKSYDAGELTYLEYLQSRQTLISSQNNYINALFNYYQYIFRLEEITGVNMFGSTEAEN